jgi:hypothetical protein
MRRRVWAFRGTNALGTSLQRSIPAPSRLVASYTLRVARLETTTARDERPPLDPYAVERAYRFHRARRAARERHLRERQTAGFRFWFVLAIVLVAAAFLAARTLGEIEHLFGL